ncbi:MAG: DNA polymerase III subunit beta [Bacteroidales bacterium]|jgi:DNA polymerase-3 subunit beta|nr:DNA polymerase III subunit beta [Bacteroidales bacterium]MDD4703856.1 DNA polymerase III subunit beta [Bacteroidales bacterium]MDX9798850.1 DNA polymerase III subunit beta [Bacteroidales bacterium]
MKFIVHGGTLSRSLQSIYSVITSNKAVPILDNFLFQLDGKTLSITASDIETTATVKLELNDADASGLTQIAVPAKILSDIVKTFSDVPLSFIVNKDTFVVEITSGEGKYKLAGISADEYPRMASVDDASQITIPSSLLVNAIAKTIFATSNDEARPQMTGVLCEQTDNHITFVGTDSHKLVRYRRTDFSNDTPISFILPKKPLNLLRNILVTYKEDIDILMDYNVKNVEFSFENYSIVCRLIEGKYPNYEAAIPKENPNKLIIDRIGFLSSVKRVSLFANQSTQQVRLKLSGNELIISAEDFDFSNAAKEKLSCNFTGEELEIGFNSRYLLEMLNNIDTENVLIEMSQPNRAGILYPYEEKAEETTESILMLVMPVMLAN